MTIEFATADGDAVGVAYRVSMVDSGARLWNKVMYTRLKTAKLSKTGNWTGFKALVVFATGCCALASGCAAVTNPVGTEGIPVNRLPPEFLGVSKEDTQPLPLPMLRQPQNNVYRLAPDDILGVWIEGVLGDKNQAPPVQFSEQSKRPPAIGFPIPVRADGTINLPFIDPLPVQGLTLVEAERVVRDAYTVKKKILQPGRERIIVTLQRPRQYSVLVIREDSGGLAVTVGGQLSTSKRGTGQVVELPAYENDVLHALASTGGLPGTEAKNEVVIQRGSFRDEAEMAAWLRQLDSCPPGRRPSAANGNAQIIRIPLRLHPGEVPDIRPEDLVLRTGDIVYIEARDLEFYYTGGLLGAKEILLPRDRDIDVVRAITQAQGPLVNGGFGQSNLSGNIQQSGIGFPNPSQVTILRRIPGYGQLPIHVDLNRALRDPRERILIQAGDVVILQNTVGEALAQYFTTAFKLDSVFTILRQRDAQSAATIVVP